MLRTCRGLAFLVLVYLVVVYVIPKPDSVKIEGWRLAGIFAATIVGSITQPIPGGALVLLAITLTAATGILKIGDALGGYSDPSVWLVIAAFIISRALIDTGLARRIALQFVRRFGKSSLGVSYSLAMSDMVLAGMIPSNGARSGGVILPIAKSIAELYGSTPGATSGLLGCFLMTAVYQSVCVTAAMFYTGQASNPLAAKMAADVGVQVTWASWFFAGLAPGLCSLAIVPWVVMKMNPPAIRHTPEAAAFASRLLTELGPMRKNEKILTAVFAGVATLWITSGTRYGMDITVTALLGCVVLISTGVLSWEQVKTERAGWDIFVWYGGFIRMAKALNDFGVTKAFAEQVGHTFSGLGWVGLFAVALLIYFYAHYGFASITAHLLSMYPPFLAVLLIKGAPAGLMVYAFACFANLSSGLTNYGTTPSPIYFAQGYVSLGQWWRIGFVISLVNITIWSTVGFAWWHLLGIW